MRVRTGERYFGRVFQVTYECETAKLFADLDVLLAVELEARDD